jgi:precorrin-2 dehydrogenase/sirohydrochlorin ferrochelatase
MIPIYLDPAAARVAVVGRGALALRRVLWLREAGATPDVWTDAPSADLEAAAPNLIRRFPAGKEMARYGAVWIADLDSEQAQRLAQAARAAGALVNVEDVISLCDFHTPAVVRRGRLTRAAGTGGASPVVARAARERLEAAFSGDWERAAEDVSQARARLRKEGADTAALIADARARLAHHGLI